MILNLRKLFFVVVIVKRLSPRDTRGLDWSLRLEEVLEERGASRERELYWRAMLLLCSSIALCANYETSEKSLVAHSYVWFVPHATLNSMTSEFFPSIVILVSRLAKRSDNPYMACKCGPCQWVVLKEAYSLLFELNKNYSWVDLLDNEVP